MHKMMRRLAFPAAINEAINRKRSSGLTKELFGITFPNPVGLAAGIDPDAKHYNALKKDGFGFIEIGSITPVPQSGKMPGKGLKNAVERLKNNPPRGIIAANICRNASTLNENAGKDYEKCFAMLYDFVDMFVVNVSSPEVDYLRDLQDVESLSEIIDKLLSLRMYFDQYKPILIKISPDLTPQVLDDIIDCVMISGIDGIVACNSCRNTEEDQYTKSLSTVKYIVKKTGGTLPVIATGGIDSPQKALEMLNCGASLVELCSAYLSRRSIVRKTLRELRKQIQK